MGSKVSPPEGIDNFQVSDRSLATILCYTKSQYLQRGTYCTPVMDIDFQRTGEASIMQLFARAREMEGSKTIPVLS